MNSAEFVEKLKHIANDLPTVYCNKYPKNCGYYDGSKYSWDCWNLIKTVICGWTESTAAGSYQKDLSTTGDIDGAGLLTRCTNKSTDFSRLSVPGTYLYMKSPAHAGVYIGEIVIGGKYYNVVEATAAWEKKVLFSWVDPDGSRRQYKGGGKKYAWTDFGLLPWINYDGATVPTSEQPTTYSLEDFRGEVMQILKAGSTAAAFTKTITISMNNNRRSALVTPLERYFKALGYYTGEIEADAGKTPIFGSGMAKATAAYQKNVVQAAPKYQDGILSKGGATWKKLLLS